MPLTDGSEMMRNLQGLSRLKPGWRRKTTGPTSPTGKRAVVGQHSGSEAAGRRVLGQLPGALVERPHKEQWAGPSLPCTDLHASHSLLAPSQQGRGVLRPGKCCKGPKQLETPWKGENPTPRTSSPNRAYLSSPTTPSDGSRPNTSDSAHWWGDDTGNQMPEPGRRACINLLHGEMINLIVVNTSIASDNPFFGGENI